MKISSLLVLGFLLASSQAMSSAARPNVIYGDDNRRDVYEAHGAFIELSRSTAAMIAPANMKLAGNAVVISAPTLQARGICAKERFSNQISAANCSGFLVAGNKLITAGHCIKSQADCAANKWVFDYRVESANQTQMVVPASSIYSCRGIITRALDSSNDFAMIQLDRVVSDRHPVRLRKSGRPAVGDDLVVIGHPTGLPTKIADGAKVRSLLTKFFTANLDTYGGNSGSAVFNVRTEEVEGILVRGENDYVKDPSGCQVSNRCAMNACRGEDVTYITNVPGISSL